MKKYLLNKTCLFGAMLCALGFISISSTQATVFTVPYRAIVFLTPVGGEAGGSTEMALGTATNASPLFTGLPGDPMPANEVRVGLFEAGAELNFILGTEFLGESGWVATTDTTSDAARGAFLDLGNSLGFGGAVAEKTGSGTWVLHLDDALSYRFDDDDNDLLIQVRLEADGDGDGVPDRLDQCPDTPTGTVVDMHGCSIAQLAPCAGPAVGGDWKNHGQYVSTVARVANAFQAVGLITEQEKGDIVRAAAQSDCGDKGRAGSRE